MVFEEDALFAFFVEDDMVERSSTLVECGELMVEKERICVWFTKKKRRGGTSPFYFETLFFGSKKKRKKKHECHVAHLAHCSTRLLVVRDVRHCSFLNSKDNR